MRHDALQAEGDAPVEESAELPRGEQVALLHRLGTFTIAGDAVAATALIALMWGVSDLHDGLLSWLLLMWVIVLVRAIAQFAYHVDRRRLLRGRVWGLRFSLGAGAAGVAWGLFSVLFFEPRLEVMYPLALALAGLNAVAVIATGLHRPALLAFAIPSLLPLALKSIWQGEPLFVGQGIATMVFLIACASLSWLYDRTIHKSMRIRFENLALLRAVRDQHGQAEQARAEAEQADAAKTRFFAAASHDLRQPVHAMNLYMALLRQNPPEHERSELLDHLRSCTDSLDRLFNAILGVSEASAGPAPPSSARPVSLQAVIGQVVVQFSPEAHRKGLRLRVRPSSLWVRADEAALGRILANLLANAIRYTDSGSIVVGVRRRGPQCHLVVADTGIGIASRDLDRIFQEFFQVDNVNRDRRRGFGLGLATVKRLCDRHGYAIAVRSQLGEGSLFSVALERTDERTDTMAAEAPQSPAAAGKVLLVEDDLLVRDAMSRMLRSWSIGVRSCSTGDEALEILKSGTLGACHVLLDFRLADGENGLEVADRIRTGIDPPPPIALITGEPDAAVYEGAARRGITVLTKPVKAIRLRALLEKPARDEAPLPVSAP